MQAREQSTCAVLVLGLWLLSTPAAEAQGMKKASDASGKHQAIQDVLRAICSAPRVPHCNTIGFPTFDLRRTGKPESKHRPITLAQPLRCGFGDDLRARLDRARAAELVGKLGKHYGVDLRSAQSVTLGGRKLVLPLADVGEKLAFTFETTEPGSKEKGLLDAAAVTALRKAGWSVHHVDLEQFRSRQSDTLSPMLAYAVSALAFLERHATRVGFDLSPYFGGATHELRFAEDKVTLSGAAHVHHDDKQLFFTVEKRATLELRLDGIRSVAGKRPALLFAGNHWTPKLRGGRYDFTGPSPEFTLVQGSVRVQPPSGVFVMPPEFSPGKPFVVRAKLPPGHYTLKPTVSMRHGRRS